MPENPNEKLVNVTVNLGALQGNYLGSIQRVLDMISFLGAGFGTVTEDTFRSFQPFMSFNPAQNRRLDFSAAKIETEHWLLRSFITDVMDRTGAFIEECRVICALYRLFSGGRRAKGVDWNRIFQGDKAKFHKLGLPEKLQALNNDFDVSSSVASHVLSLNRARNCLVHRQGIVGAKDIDDSGHLKVVWRTTRLIATDVKTGVTTTIEIEPTRIEAESAIAIQLIDHERTFKLGEPITLTFKELYHCVMTLFMFSLSLTKSIESYSRKAGVKTSDEAIDPAVGPG